VAERLKWKPKQPLSVLLLRVYALPQPQIIAYRSEYGGCKSWIDLQFDPALEVLPDQAQPVLTDTEYQAKVAAIGQALSVLTADRDFNKIQNSTLANAAEDR
jgi:hypothetical protein